jgi:hypothetical protein
VTGAVTTKLPGYLTPTSHNTFAKIRTWLLSAKENRLEQAIRDLERLMDSEDSFQWPLLDPQYCLALGMFRKFNEQFFANLPEDEQGEAGGGNWRNNLRLGLNECICHGPKHDQGVGASGAEKLFTL